mgnify:CR=1 FL=1
MNKENTRSLIVYKIYKLFRGNSFLYNMDLILNSYKQGMSTFGALFSAYVCVVQLLVNVGAYKEADKYVDLMCVILENAGKELIE